MIRPTCSSADLGGVGHVLSGSSAPAGYGRHVVEPAPHVAGLVDAAEGEQHAAPVLVVHDREGRVGGPDVATRVVRVVAR